MLRWHSAPDEPTAVLAPVLRFSGEVSAEKVAAIGVTPTDASLARCLQLQFRGGASQRPVRDLYDSTKFVKEFFFPLGGYVFWVLFLSLPRGTIKQEELPFVTCNVLGRRRSAATGGGSTEY